MIRYRYRRIVLFFARVLTSIFLLDILLPRLGLGRLTKPSRVQRLQRSARAFRSMAVELGGVLIKVGQFLSTRVDVLPVEVTDELSGLQDEVPPERFEDVRKVAESEFGVSLEEKFAFFDHIPLAAASLGQVHRAGVRVKAASSPSGGGESTSEELDFEDKNGLLDVVVKIQRLNIEAVITTDLAALRTVGGWLQRYKPIRRRADVPALLAEFTRILYEEVDYLAEGRNAETFAANFIDDFRVRVPRVVWSHTTKRALTLQNVYSIKITDYDAITAAGIDRSEVASRLLDTYLKQIFEDGFFHADPHPGNLFVFPLPAAGQSGNGHPLWQLTFVDFGMVGRITPQLRKGLREMVIAVGTQDSARLVRSYQEVGVLLPSADLNLLEKAEAKAFERFWGKNMSELQEITIGEVREFLGEFRQLVYSMPFQVPHNIIFLARAVSILSGMCTGLDPHFNVWEHLTPYAQKLIADEARNSPEFWLDELKTLGRSLLTVPIKMDAMLGKMERGEIAVQAPQVVEEVDHLERALRGVAGAVVFAALLLGGVLIHLAGPSILGDVLLWGAGLSLIWTIFISRRRN